MRKPQTIKKEIKKTEDKLKYLKKEFSEAVRAEACKIVETWSPDLKLMLGPLPKPINESKHKGGNGNGF